LGGLKAKLSKSQQQQQQQQQQPFYSDNYTDQPELASISGELEDFLSGKLYCQQVLAHGK